MSYQHFFETLKPNFQETAQNFEKHVLQKGLRITFYTYKPVNPFHSLKKHQNRCTLLPIGYRRLNLTYPNIKSAHTHGPHHPWTPSCIAMSNQRSFKIGSFCFVAFVPKQIEYNSFFKQNSGSKQNIFNQFYKILVQKLLFWFVSKFV